jgi:hypothetical protein
MLINLELRKQKEEDHKFKANLDYVKKKKIKRSPNPYYLRM